MIGIESKPSISLLLLILSIFLLSLSPPSHAAVGRRFNIFTYLSDYPEYSQFLDLLNRTLLARDISAREQITVLVVRNENIGDFILQQKLDVLQPLLCAHVLLEFIDKSALKYGYMKFPHQVFTVYQTTGAADAEQGQVKIYRTQSAFLIGSAIKGVRPSVRIVKLVRGDQTSHSVLEVSGIIVTPGISDEILPPPGVALPPPTPKRSPKAPIAPSTDDYDDATADSPADSPADSVADAPAESPEDDSAAADDEIVPEEEDADKSAVEDADDKKPASGAGRTGSSLVVSAVICSILAAVIL